MRSPRWKALTTITLAVTVSMTTGEFIEVQKLSQSCDPSLTALNTDPAANQMTVAIECRTRVAPPGERREPRPAGKGS